MYLTIEVVVGVVGIIVRGAMIVADETEAAIAKGAETGVERDGERMFLLMIII